jgi:hypothetical protein
MTSADLPAVLQDLCTGLQALELLNELNALCGTDLVDLGLTAEPYAGRVGCSATGLRRAREKLEQQKNAARYKKTGGSEAWLHEPLDLHVRLAFVTACAAASALRKSQSAEQPGPSVEPSPSAS